MPPHDTQNGNERSSVSVTSDPAGCLQRRSSGFATGHILSCDRFHRKQQITRQEVWAQGKPTKSIL